MTAIDTNVVVRLLANDDPRQAGRAARLLSAGKVLVPATVLLETEWVLRAAYGAERPVIAQALRKFLALPDVVCDQLTAVLQALDAYSAGLDFADAMHLAMAKGTATRFASFDRDLKRRAARLHGAIPVFEPEE